MDFPEPTGPLYSSLAHPPPPGPGPRVKLMRPRYTSCREGFPSSEPTASNFLPLTSLPTIMYPPPDDDPPVRQRPDGSPQSPFLRLPAEIRLQIYALLVLPREPTHLLPSFQKINASAQDYFDYDKKQYGTDRPATADLSRPTLLMRTIDGTKYPELYDPKNKPHKRSNYSVRADRFRNRCMTTTYHCVNLPRVEHHLGILAANKQIHAEAAELLYSSYTFDFDTHVEAIVPFLRDLTPFARRCVKTVRLVKRALPYDKEFDRAEWSTALRYLTSSTSNVHLRKLELGIVAGRPGRTGWDRIPTYSARDFELLKDVAGMEWMQYLLEFRGLQELDVNAVVEHCPPAVSSMAMAGYIRFSASVETGFAEFIRGHLLGAAA